MTDYRKAEELLNYIDSKVQPMLGEFADTMVIMAKGQGDECASIKYCGDFLIIAELLAGGFKCAVKGFAEQGGDQQIFWAVFHKAFHELEERKIG